MMRNAQPIRTQLLTAIMAGVVGAGLSTAATAKGSSAGVNANTGADAQVASLGYVQAGGAADAHMNAYVSTSPNAQWQSGATLGAERARERTGMNSDGLAPSATAEPEPAGKVIKQAKRSGTR